MRTQFDFSPLFRTAVGFDRLARAADAATRYSGDGNYPPYNIEKVDEDHYRVTLAVAGFGKDDIEVVAEQGTLTVKGQLPKAEDNGVTYLYRGIAGRAFERKFQLADHIEVTDGRLDNGVLTIDLVRKLPEALKPRTIAIENGGKKRRLTKKAA